MLARAKSGTPPWCGQLRQHRRRVILRDAATAATPAGVVSGITLFPGVFALLRPPAMRWDRFAISGVPGDIPHVHWVAKLQRL
jgi:hypothetical protein